MRSKITKNLSPPPIKLDPPRKIRTFSWRTYNIFLNLRFGYFILAPPRVIRPSHEETFAETTLFAARLPTSCTSVVLFSLRKSGKKNKYALCIPVRCVPPDCCPHPVISWGVSVQRWGLFLAWGVCRGGGCILACNGADTPHEQNQKQM